jgi:Tfp pilus assembly protein PilN
MVATINLIPEEEIQEQQKVKSVKITTVLTIIILVVVALASAALFYYTFGLRRQKNQLESDVQGLRTEIDSRKTFEIEARNLSKKVNGLSSILDKRVHYSLLLEELAARKPEALKITGLTVKDGSFTLSGNSNSYLVLSTFMNNLGNKKFDQGSKNLQPLFTAIHLQSVNLSDNKKDITFALTIKYDSSLLNYKNRGL